MTDTQFYVALAVQASLTGLIVTIGIVLNLKGLNDLRRDMMADFSATNERLQKAASSK